MQNMYDIYLVAEIWTLNLKRTHWVILKRVLVNLFRLGVLFYDEGLVSCSTFKPY